MREFDPDVSAGLLTAAARLRLEPGHDKGVAAPLRAFALVRNVARPVSARRSDERWP